MPSSSCPLPPPSFSEADLFQLWRDQTFPPEALVTSGGERLRLIYRGRAGRGAGPDFRDALIAARGSLLKGDVELHVRAGDFRRHGHNRDAAYAGVVLHVVFRDDEGTPTPLPGGGAAPVVALAGWVHGRAAEIESWLRRPALWREPCFSAVRRLGEAEVGASLERLGDMRFRQKAAGFASRMRDVRNEKWDVSSLTAKTDDVGREEREIEGGRMESLDGDPPTSFLSMRPPVQANSAGADQVFWEALLDAFGYGGEREGWRLLGQRLPWSDLRERLAPLAARVRAEEAGRSLVEAAAPLALRGGRRPAGRPETRLRGAAQLAARFSDEGPHAMLARALESEPKEAQRRLIALLTVAGAIGRGRAVEIIANVVLPGLAALGPEASARRAEALYRRLPPAARYGAVRHLHEAVGGALAVNFRRQQGMLYLLKQYCTRGGCGRCPLS